MSEVPWVKLDNAAKIFPSVSSHRLTHLFRLSVRLRQPVQPERLERALRALIPRFPSFRYRLVPGFFWYTLVEDQTPPSVFPDSASPCMPFKKSPSTLYRVRWFGRRLAVEFNHTLTDGIGGLVFLKALTAEYLQELGVASEDAGDLRRTRSALDPNEAEDAFQNLYDPSFPPFSTWDRAYQPPYRLLAPGAYAVTTGRLSVSEVLKAAKARNATLTEFLAASLLAAFQDSFYDLPAAARRRLARPLRVVIPVNLRGVFPSSTLRNFFVVVPVEIDLRLGRYDFDEIVRKVHFQLQAEMDPKLLKKQIMRNLRGELNPLARLLPLPLKNLVLSGVYGSYEHQHTASLSNLGRVQWPDPWSQHVEHVDFTPPPSPFCRVNAGVVSCGDVLSITFGNLSHDPAVERAFFTFLRRQGLSVSVESNRSVLEV